MARQAREQARYLAQEDRAHFNLQRVCNFELGLKGGFMKRPSTRKKLLRIPSLPTACVLAVLICLFWLPGNLMSAGPQKSVLLIFDARSDMLGNIIVDQAIRKSLFGEFGVDLDIRSEYFEVSGTPKDEFRNLLAWLKAKYSSTSFDVVVPVGTLSLQFVDDYGNVLFPRSKIVFWGRRTAMQTWKSARPITGVVAPTLEVQIQRTFSFVQRLQPDLKRLVVVTGSSDVDKNWETAARRELDRYRGLFLIDFWAGLSVEEVETKLKSLPPQSAVLFLSISTDGVGRRLLRTQYLGRVVEIAAAPVYSMSVPYLDTGTVGGVLVDQEAMARDTAEIIRSLLHGADVSHTPVRETPLTPMVNWKAMRRWNLSEKRLPANAVVAFKDPSLWETYRWHIIGGSALFIVQSSLIVGLVIHRGRRRKAEKSMAESQALLQSTIDALSARVALLDQRGTIIAVNRSWAEFTEENPCGDTINGLGHNYLERRATDAERKEPGLVTNGIRRVITGDLEAFRCVYSSQHPGGMFWFQVRVNPFEMQGARHLVVTHEDVTEIKEAHDTQQRLTGLLMQAQDEERRRIARDLHDVTVQNVVAIKADLSFLENARQPMDSRHREMLRESASLCDQVMQELRTLSYVLHPPFLDEAGLTPAIQWFVRGFIQRSGVHVALIAKDDVGRLKKEAEIALFRVVQESLTNIHRHSGSRNAIIRLTREQDSVVLRITDDGHGFSTPPAIKNESTASHGVGIAAMRHRLKQLGGELEIESSSEGTTIHARVLISEDRIHAYSIS
jgi:PAS domain S-box-containing protein